MREPAEQPWARVPAGTATALRPALPALADEIVDAIGREVPDYARPMAGEFGRGVRIGVERALDRFLNLLGRTDAEADEQEAADRRVYVGLGRGEFRAGRSLDALLAAYRLGARIAWRRFVEAGERAGVQPATLYLLGEAIFAYIDGISAESADGYAQEQSAAAGERQRVRRALVRLLAAAPPPAPEDLRAAAERAAWPLPAALAALATGEADAGRLGSRLGPDVLAAELAGATIAFVPDPEGPGRQAQLAEALGGRAAALGPAVAPGEAGVSVARARLALGLAADGVLPADRLVITDDHLPTLLLHADRRLAADLAARALAPLAELKPDARERLHETLRAWLDHCGRVEAVAGALDVHPQTVRYRLNQLREVLGTALDDVEARFALTLAVRTCPKASS